MTSTSERTPTPIEVLVVEDNEDDARLVLKALTQGGFAPAWRRVDREIDFRAALGTSLDLILCDFGLPGWDAMDALALTRQHDHDVPFILVSGTIDDEAAVRAIRMGATDYVLKDRLARLGPAVEAALEARRLRAEKRANDAERLEEHRAAEHKLRESERRFRALVEHSWDAIVLFAADGTVRYSSPSTSRLLGHSAEELIGRLAADFVHPGDLESLGRSFSACAAQREPLAASARVRHRDGSYRELDGLLTNLLDDPAVGAMVANFRDVTDSKRTQAVLDASQERLRHAVAAGNVGLWDWDLTTNEVYYSPEWKQQIGYEVEEIGPGLEEWESRVHPDDLGPAMAAVNAYVAGTAPTYEVVFRFRQKDGSYRHILARGSKMLGDDGLPRRLLGSHIDITARTELQAQLLQAQKMETVGKLAGGIAHDFNNLIQVINATAEIASEGLRDGDPLRDDLTEIRRAGERSAALTRQLLAFSRRQIMAPIVLDLGALLDGLKSMLRRVIGENIRLEVRSMDGCSVEADPGQLEQVILNLVVNARDALPAGGMVTIETSRVELDEAFAAQHPGSHAGPHVRLTVTDTGTGMDEATMSRVFEPFFTTKAVGQGTGLGLATVHGIIHQSGGTIRVRSTLGAGTTFELELPRIEALSQARAREASVTSATTHGTILMVEDEIAIRRVAVRILLAAGHRVLVAANGGEALLVAERHPGPIDLLFTDVVMPGMSGRELSDRLTGLRPEMRTVFTSGYTDDSIVRHGVLDDPGIFLRKPYTPAELRDKVGSVLQARPRAEE